MTYLLIFESGDANQADELTPEDWKNADAGFCDVYQFVDGKFQHRNNGVWEDVER